jgi:excisionase family DNA binding protein
MKANYTSIDDFFDQVIGKMESMSKNIDFIKSKFDKSLKPDMLYTPKEVASILKCCDRSVYHHLSNGSLKSIRIGRKYYINSEALDEFMAKGSSGREQF